MRKLGSLLAAALAGGGVGVLGPPSMSPAAADPVATSRSCTVGSVTWRVDYTSWPDSGFGPLVKVDGLKKIVGTTVTPAETLTWEWRVENRPQDIPADPGTPFAPFRSKQGPLTPTAWPEGGEWQTAFYSPRLVAPDASCTIYLAPFSDQHSPPTWPRVAVLGDSLTQSLNDPSYNANEPQIQGYVEGILNMHSTLAEAEGLGGGRWAQTHEEADPGNPATPLAKTFYPMLDEFRGLADHNPDGFVVALGTNDALGILITGYGPGGFIYRPAAEVPGVRTEIHNRWMETVGEMLSRTDCLVIVTAPEHSNAYAPTQPFETTQINNLARWFDAQGGSFADLHVVDFALEAKNHPYNSDPGEAGEWFVSDDVHLNFAGKLVYTAMIGQAAEICA